MFLCRALYRKPLQDFDLAAFGVHRFPRGQEGFRLPDLPLPERHSARAFVGLSRADGTPGDRGKLAGAFVPARVAAANAIWGRPYGKPEQTTINYNETLDGFTDDEISGFLAALRADLGPEAGDVKSVGTPPGKARKPQEAERGSGRPH
jgi:hypothetical protein